MGIDVSIYVWMSDDYPTDARFQMLPELDLRESYFRNDIYATKILFPEAWNEDHKTLYMQNIQPRPGVLRSRLPQALEAIEQRCRNMPGEDTPQELKEFEREQKELFTKFVEKYEEAIEDGTNPMITVSY